MITSDKIQNFLLKKTLLKIELKTGTRFVYNPDLAGPIFSTPFIKKIWAKNDGKIIITPKNYTTFLN